MKNESFSQRYSRMMSGKIVPFSENEIVEVLCHLDYYRINTLEVQCNSEKTNGITKWFNCRVDKVSVRQYLKEKESEMRIV